MPGVSTVLTLSSLMQQHLLACVVLCAAALAANATTTVVTVKHEVVATVDARFASFTHDIQDFIGYNIAPWDFDWSGSAPLRSLVGALAPLAVRCGGTWEDGIYWQDGPQTGRFPGIPHSMVSHVSTSKVLQEARNKVLDQSRVSNKDVLEK